ncbi:MAG: glycosyl hydrolase-related protein [Christensenellales bacterium]
MNDVKTNEKKLIIYFSGTHWDREWYQSRVGYRYKLVKVVDELIDYLERHEEFRTFYFDAQTVVLEDYCEARPENRDRLTKLIGDGRIVVGPWYCMPDEFLVSGEALIRNLLTGHKLAKRYGAAEAWKNGYVCDIFGHIAQLPQIFNGFGIENAVLGRGTNESDTRAFFNWISPSGNKLTVFKLQDMGGYGGFAMEVCGQRQKGRELDAEDPEFRKAARAYIDHALEYSPVKATVIFDAMDHEPVHTKTPDYIEEIKKMYPDCEVEHGNIERAFEIAKKGVLESKKGELIATAPKKVLHLFLITNTLSARYDLKKRNDACQAKLEKNLEPLMFFAAESGFVPQGNFMEFAWKNLLQVQAHDSICGCSVDRVHADMQYNYSQAESVYETLLSEYAQHLTGEFRILGKDGCDGFSVFNPMPYETETSLTLRLPIAQDYEKYFEGFGYEKICAFRLCDEQDDEIPYRIEKFETNRTIRTCSEAVDCCDMYTITFRAKLRGMGMTRFHLLKSHAPVRFRTPAAAHGTLENGYIRAQINRDGTIKLYDKKTSVTYDGLLRFEDDGEIGDGWFSVRPKCGSLTVGAAAESLEILSCNETGSSLLVNLRMKLPVRAENTISGIRRSEVKEDLNIRAFVTLNSGERFLRVKVVAENNVRDHRLKAVFPTFTDSETYTVNQSFCFVERRAGVDEATLGWKEPDQLEKNTAGIVVRRDAEGRGLAVVAAGGLHECACDRNAESSIDLTLYRCFEKTYTTNGESDGELLGNLEFDFCIAPVDETVSDASLQRLQDMQKIYFTPIIGCDCDIRGSLLNIDNGDICFSALKPAENGNAQILRLYNPTDGEEECALDIGFTYQSVKKCNLLEEPLEDVLPERLKIKAYEIVTLRIER